MFAKKRIIWNDLKGLALLGWHEKPQGQAYLVTGGPPWNWIWWESTGSQEAWGALGGVFYRLLLPSWKETAIWIFKCSPFITLSLFTYLILITVSDSIITHIQAFFTLPCNVYLFMPPIPRVRNWMIIRAQTWAGRKQVGTLPSPLSQLMRVAIIKSLIPLPWDRVAFFLLDINSYFYFGFV